MAVSGNETTRIGASLHGVGKRLVITAKAETVELLNIIRKTLVSVGTKIGSRQPHNSATKG